VLALSFVLAVAPLLLLDVHLVRAATIVVPDDYSTIQEAINAANEGDTVFVRNGTYHERLVVNKTLSLVGEEPQNTTIDGDGLGYVVNIRADSVYVTGLTISNSGFGYAGIRLAGANHCNIFQNNIKANNEGIEVILPSSNNNVSGNNITANGGGIAVEWSTDNNSIVGNNIAANSVGVFLAYANNNSIAGNNITNNAATGVSLGSYSYHNSVSGNKITDNEIGIAVGSYTDNNSVVENSLVNNSFGVRIYPICSGNLFYYNSFIGNTQQGNSSWGSSNVWDGGHPSGGNYWSDYNGTDSNSGTHQNETNSDGLGDVPYVIDENNTDRYPLMKPYAGPHDVGLLVSVSKTVVAQGFNITVRTDMKIVNYGMQEETCNFTFDIIGTFNEQTITLASRNSTNLSFAWNTTDFALGDHVIMAYVAPVEGETDTSDNAFSCVVCIGVPGDVDGNHIVDMADVYYIADCFGARRGHETNYVSNYDIDDNGISNMLDLYIAATHFGEADP
jgi:parallel beta-helix repeat protein